MDKDIKKLLSIILLAAVFIGGPIIYFLHEYEKTVEIEAAKKIELPEEENPVDPEKEEPEGNIIKEEETVIGKVDSEEKAPEEENPEEGAEKEPDKEPEEEVPEEEKSLLDDGKEGLIVDNTRPDHNKPDTPSVYIGPTTGKMGSIVNAHDPSGFKEELADKIFDLAGEIKTNPKNIREENRMKYYSDNTDEKRVQQVMGNLMEKALMKGEKKVLPPTSFDFDGSTYLVTTMDTWVLETPYDNAEGILNDIKIEEPGFLQVAFFPELDSFSYNYGEVKIYFDTEKDKNIVMMVLYNFVKLNEE